MRTRYTDYVQSCLRWYVRHLDMQKFKSYAQKQDWKACHDAFEKFSESERQMLMAIYYERDTVPDNVYQVAEARGIKQNIIWGLVNELERRVAKRRGLL